MGSSNKGTFKELSGAQVIFIICSAETTNLDPRLESWSGSVEGGG